MGPRLPVFSRFFYFYFLGGVFRFSDFGSLRGAQGLGWASGCRGLILAFSCKIYEVLWLPGCLFIVFQPSGF